MRIAKTSGDIYKEFIIQDPGTIIRKPNLRRFVKQNKIRHYETNTVWLINSVAFYNKLNPKHLQEHDFIIPRLRCIKTAVIEWNGSHQRYKDKIDKHTIEKAMNKETVFKIFYGNRWIINYDQLEPEIEKIVKKRSI